MGTSGPQDSPALSIWPDRAALMEAAARHVIQVGARAIERRRQFSWVLSGGSTPRALYGLLADERMRHALDWTRVSFFWGDERCVGPAHPDSNFRMARETLLDALRLRPEQVHRLRGEDDPAQAAAAYEAELRAALPGVVGPAFDLILLGMGADGHTASLFPGSLALAETERWVVPTCAPSGAWRLTLTLPAINAAAHVTFVVAGADKAARVHEVLTAPERELPAARVRPGRGELQWMLDAKAAGGLSWNSE